jgi:hypothetical protein
MRGLFITLALAAVAVSRPAAQAPTRPKTPAAAPKAASVRISIHDHDGAPVPGTRLLLSGGDTGEFTTGAAGTAIVPNLKAGTYRVRCEHDGFVTLERDFTLGSSAWNPIEIVLDAAPPPPPPPKPAPEPPPPVAPTLPAGPPVMVSIPDFVDKNYIGRDPLKESILACKPLETVRLLQMRDAIAPHAHERLDEIIYVIAGEGAVRFADKSTPIRAGSLVVVPNGNSHAFERSGKNPLVVMSTLVGAACESTKTSASQ